MVIETTLKRAILYKRRPQKWVRQTAPVLVPRYLRGTKSGAVWRTHFWGRHLYKIARLGVVSITTKALSRHVLQVAKPYSWQQRAPPLDGSDFVCVLWTHFQGRLGTVLTRQGNEQTLSDVEKYCSYPLPTISMLRKPVT